MKLYFEIDKEYDWQCTKKFTDISKKEFDLMYSNLQEPLEWSVVEFQKNWDLINDQFSEYIGKTMGTWQNDLYICVLSVIHHGISNWGKSNKIVRGWWENPYKSRKITAHELIIPHYFYLYRKHYSDRNLTDGQIWALAEIAAFALTSKTNEVKNFWPWDIEYDINHNYPILLIYKMN